MISQAGASPVYVGPVPDPVSPAAEAEAKIDTFQAATVVRRRGRSGAGFDRGPFAG